ncbi:MAG: hypothetical protein IPL27_06475 [Lewinellaceae bacterium]|nr:hypothetical protein [Lewinellaceae bacterium]
MSRLSGGRSSVAPTPLTAAVGNTSYFVSQTTSSSPAVSVLAAGNIAIISYDDVTDIFGFVPFVNLAAGTTIYFTDNGWDQSLNGGMGGFSGATITDGNGTEGFVRYVVPAGGVTAGTIVYSNNSNTGGFTSSMTAIPPGLIGNFTAINFSGDGDQIYAFQNSNLDNPLFNNGTMTHLFVLDNTNAFENTTNSNQGNIPPGLTGVTANTFPFSGSAAFALNNNGMPRTAVDWLAYMDLSTNYTTGATAPAITNLNVILDGPSLCESDRAEIVVTVMEPATAMIPAVQPVCVNTLANPSSIILSVVLGGGAESGMGSWSANIGGGSFAPNNTNDMVTYTPPLNFSGNILFTYTTNNPAGPCPAVMATRTVEVQTGGVNAVPDQIICAGESVSLNATLGSGATTPVSWSASVMGGSFAPDNNIVSVYTPPADFTGTITLTPHGYRRRRYLRASARPVGRDSASCPTAADRHHTCDILPECRRRSANRHRHGFVVVRFAWRRYRRSPCTDSVYCGDREYLLLRNTDRKYRAAGQCAGAGRSGDYCLERRNG